MKRTWPDVAGFGDGGMWSQNKEFWCPQEAGKEQQNSFFPRTFEKNIALLTP